MMLEKIQFIEALTPTWCDIHLRHSILHEKDITRSCIHPLKVSLPWIDLHFHHWGMEWNWKFRVWWIDHAVL